MNKEIPFFSVPSVYAKNYHRFRNVKAYLNGLLNAYHFGIDTLMEISGYRKKQKFIDHQDDWHELSRKIPLKYLDEIGAKHDKLMELAELDGHEFDAALQIPRMVNAAGIRVMPAIAACHQFKEPLSEEEAVRTMKNFSNNNRMISYISISNLKTIWIEPGDKVIISYYRPALRFDKQFMYAISDGSRIGKVYLI